MGPPVTYFCPALDPPMGGSSRKTTSWTLVRDHEYFIPTKFHQNPSSGSGEEVENVKSLRTTTATTDGALWQYAILWLRWAKNKNMLKLINSACDICDNDIANCLLPVTKIAWKTTLCALLAGNYIFKPSRRVPWNLFLFLRMNTFVYYHSALLAHFPPEDTKIAEELRGAPRESRHNRDFEETVNLIVDWVFGCPPEKCGGFFSEHFGFSST